MNHITGFIDDILEASPLTTIDFESPKRRPRGISKREYDITGYVPSDGTAKVAQKDCRLYTTGYDIANAPIFYKMEFVI